MITVWLLRPLRSTSPRSRATLSVGPPAANGTTMVTGFSGYWAHAAEVANRAAANNERVFMLGSPGACELGRDASARGWLLNAGTACPVLGVDPQSAGLSAKCSASTCAAC